MYKVYGRDIGKNKREAWKNISSLHTYTVFWVFKRWLLKLDKVMKVTRIKKIKAWKLTAANKMEKRVILVGLIVHIFFKNRCHVWVALSVGCQFHRFLQSEMGIHCFIISFNLWKWSHACVSLFFVLVVQMFNLNMSHLIFLLHLLLLFLLPSPPSTCAHTSWTDCLFGSYVGIDQVGQPCHWGISKCACAWVSVQHSWYTFVYLL